MNKVLSDFSVRARNPAVVLCETAIQAAQDDNVALQCQESVCFISSMSSGNLAMSSQSRWRMRIGHSYLNPMPSSGHAY